MQIGNITRVIIHFEPLQILMTANGKWLLQVLRLSGFPPGGWQGIGWFRLHLSVDSSLLHLPLALEVDQMGASEIYLDRIWFWEGGNFKEEEVRRRSLNPKAISFRDKIGHVIAACYSNFSAEFFFRETVACRMILTVWCQSVEIKLAKTQKMP